MKTIATLRLFLLCAVSLICVTGINAQLNTSFTDQVSCNGVVTFTAAQTGYSSYTWNFGDNTTATGPSVTHDYAAQGNYNVTLTIQNAPDSNSGFATVYVGQFIQQQLTGPTDVCSGSTASYLLNNASSNLQYTWLASGATLLSNTQADSAQLSFTVPGAAVASVIISNGAGCDSILTQNITVHPSPQLTLPGTVSDSQQVAFTICQNTPVWYHVLSNTAGNITWSSPAGTTLSVQGVDSMLFLFPGAGVTIIQIAEVTPWGCTDTVTASVTISANPQVTVSAISACLGTGNEFTATSNPPNSPLTYQWIFDDGTQVSGMDVTHTFTNTGTHSGEVIAINSNGCIDTASATTTVDNNPGPTVTCIGPVCAGAQEVYSTPVVAGASYHWAITGGTITAGGGLTDNTVAVTWSNGAMGTVSLYLTGPGTYCQVAITETVPLVGGAQVIQGTTTPCLYNTIDYSTQLIPGGVYTWATTTGAIVSGQGTPQVQIQFNSTTAGTVSVNISHQILGCSSSATLTVTPLSPFAVYGSATACAGIPVNYTTAVAGNFNWTVTGGTIISGNGTNAISVLWNSAGNYNVQASIATGYCNTISALNVSVISRKQENVQGSSVTCTNSTETYSISPNEYTYAWTAKGGTITGASNSNSVVVTWGTTGIDSLMVIYDNSNYCPDTAYYQVIAAPQGVPAISGDTLVCYGTTVNYSFTPVTGVSYAWETTGGAITSGQGTSTVSVMWIGNQAGVLRLRNTACNTFSQVNVVIRPVPPVHIETLNLNCTGSSVDLKVVEDYPGYSWSNGGSTQDITITAATIYNVTVTDSKGCTATAAENANPVPSNGFTSASILVSGPVSPYPYPYLQLIAQASPVPTSYQWNTGNTEASDYVSNAGTYTVTMTDQYGCTASQNVIVTLTGNVLSGGGGVIAGGGGAVLLPCPGISPVFTTNSPVCNPVQFTPGVTAAYYLWDFGDNVYSSASNPSHRFTTAGTQTITLNYSNDGINWYQCTQTLVINSVMNINFTVAAACNGATTLTNISTSALPVSSVLWSFGDGTTSGTTPTVSHTYATTSPTYQVTLTLNDGVCTDQTTNTVAIEQLVANFTYADVCVNNPALFNDATAHSALISSYSWNFGNGQTEDYSDPVTYFPAASNYTVDLTVTDANGCSGVSTQSVPVNQFGTLAITPGGPLTFCQGSSVNLSLPPGYTVYWNTGDTGTTINVTQSGIYFAFAKDIASGCSGFSDTVTVIENIPPTAFIGNPGGATSYCTGTQFNLNGLPYSGVTTYQWYLNGTAYSTSSNVNVYYAQTIQSGSYQLVITDANGCNDTSAPLQITVNPLPNYPVITQSPAGTICSGQPVTLGVTGSDLYTWSDGISGNNTTIYQPGSYEVVATNSFGCTSNNYTYVSLNPSPDFTLFPTGCYQICQNSNITVSGPSGMQTYLWSNGTNTQSIVLNTGGIYTLSATATDGCSGQSGSFSIDVFGSANLNLGNDTTICAGQPLVLEAGGYPTIQWQDGSTNPTYNVIDSGLYWAKVTTSQGCIYSDSIHVNIDTLIVNIGDDTTICNSSGLLLSANGNYISTVWQNGSTASTYTVTQSGTYFVNVTDANGCKAGDTIQVNLAGANISISPGDDTTICAGAVLPLLVTGNFTSVTWQDGSTSPAYTVVDSGLYWVHITTAQGCSLYDSIHVNVDTLVINLGDDTTVCNTISLPLTVNGNFTSIIWQNGSTTNTYTVTGPGLYYVNVTDVYGCKASDSITVSYYPPIQFNNQSAVYLCNQTVTLSAGGQFSNYIWSDGANTDTTTVAAIGVFTVTVTDNNGCTASDSINVLNCDTNSCAGSYFVPNAFTPNGDGHNDDFSLFRKPDTEPAGFFAMAIYDRSGELVFETNNEAAAWDGYFKGKPAPEGVYLYVIKYTCMSDDLSIKGSVTLLR